MHRASVNEGHDRVSSSGELFSTRLRALAVLACGACSACGGTPVPSSSSGSSPAACVEKLLGARVDHYEVVGAPTAITATDLDGDGLPDLVVGGEGVLSVLFGAGGGAFAKDVVIAGEDVTTIAARDLNGDGYADLVVGGGSTIPRLFFNRGDGSFDNGVPLSMTGAASFVIADDLNGTASRTSPSGASSRGR